MRTHTILAIILMALVAMAGVLAVTQSHPLSAITPVNVTLNMAQRGIINATSINVTDSDGTLRVGLSPLGNIYASGNLTYSGRVFILDTYLLNTTVIGGLNVTAGNLTIADGNMKVHVGNICIGSGGCVLGANSTGYDGRVQIFDDTPQPPFNSSFFGPDQLYVENNTGIGGSLMAPFIGLVEATVPGIFSFNSTIIIGGDDDTISATHKAAIIAADSEIEGSGSIGFNPTSSSLSTGNFKGNLTISDRGGLCVTGEDGVCDNAALIWRTEGTGLVVDDGAFCVTVEGSSCGPATKGDIVVPAGSVCISRGGCNITGAHGGLLVNTRLQNVTANSSLFQLDSSFGTNGDVVNADVLYLTGVSGNTVGPTIRLDANSSGGQGGHQWDLIATASGASPGGGAFGFWDNTISRYVMVLFGRDGTGRVHINGTSLPTRALGVSGGALATNGFATGGPDIAEAITVADPTIEAGDVLAADPDSPVTAIKTRHAHDTAAIGIVSTKPGIELYPSDGMDVRRVLRDDERLLAIAGRVPVKVTDENGPIQAGDHLVPATLPGRAMRLVLLPYSGKETPAELARKQAENARRMDAVVGKALEPWARGEGKIIAMVTIG